MYDLFFFFLRFINFKWIELVRQHQSHGQVVKGVRASIAPLTTTRRGLETNCHELNTCPISLAKLAPLS